MKTILPLFGVMLTLSSLIVMPGVCGKAASPTKPAKPKWDYNGWGWLSFNKGLFKIAVPPDSKFVMATVGKPMPITNTKDNPVARLVRIG